MTIESDGAWDPNWTKGVARLPDGYTPAINHTPSPVELYGRVFPDRKITNILSERENRLTKN